MLLNINDCFATCLILVAQDSPIFHWEQGSVWFYMAQLTTLLFWNYKIHYLICRYPQLKWQCCLPLNLDMRVKQNLQNHYLLLSQTEPRLRQVGRFAEKIGQLWHGVYISSLLQAEKKDTNIQVGCSTPSNLVVPWNQLVVCQWIPQGFLKTIILEMSNYHFSQRWIS